MLEGLRGRGQVDRHPPTTTERLYFDTFDGRLHRAGLSLEGSVGAGGRPVRLTLHEAGGPTSTAVASGSAERLFLTDVEPGALHDRLAGVVDVRALLPQARARIRRTTTSLRNREGKIVVRLAFEEAFVLRRGRDPVVLGTRLAVIPVLGYGAALARTIGALESMTGLARPAQTLADEVIEAAGGRPSGVSSKVDVPLRPGMRADDATLALCRRLAEVVDMNLPGTLADLDSEFLHDLRVAIRRTRSLLREMKGVLAVADRDRSRVDLRWVQEVTGPTRDLDVLLLEWPDLAAHAGAHAAADLEPIRAELITRRDAGFRQMRSRLKGQRFAAVWSAWKRTIDRNSQTEDDRQRANGPLAVERLAGRRVGAVYRDMVHEGRQIDDSTPAEVLHDLRKRGKELRYLLELFGPLWPADAVKPMLSIMKGLQDTLGRFQDNQIQATFLRSVGLDLAGETGGPDALLALGLVIQELARDQRVARQTFAERFAVFAAADTEKLVRATFGVDDRPGAGGAKPALPAAAPKASKSGRKR